MIGQLQRQKNGVRGLEREARKKSESMSDMLKRTPEGLETPVSYIFIYFYLFIYFLKPILRHKFGNTKHELVFYRIILFCIANRLGRLDNMNPFPSAQLL